METEKLVIPDHLMNRIFMVATRFLPTNPTVQDMRDALKAAYALNAALVESVLNDPIRLKDSIGEIRLLTVENGMFVTIPADSQ